MKKSDIAGRVADRIGLSQSAAGNAVEAVFEAVGEALANGEEVRIAGFGTFGTRNRPARTGRNPCACRGERCLDRSLYRISRGLPHNSSPSLHKRR